MFPSSAILCVVEPLAYYLVCALIILLNVWISLCLLDWATHNNYHSSREPRRDDDDLYPNLYKTDPNESRGIIMMHDKMVLEVVGYDKTRWQVRYPHIMDECFWIPKESDLTPNP